MDKLKDIEKKYDFNNQQVYRMISFFVAGAIVLTLIYAEFQYLKVEKQVLENRLDKKIHIINDLEKRVSKLEQKGSDNP